MADDEEKDANHGSVCFVFGVWNGSSVFYRTGERNRRHFFAHAHPRFALRFYLRTDLGICGRILPSVFAFGCLFHAGVISQCCLDGIGTGNLRMLGGNFLFPIAKDLSCVDSLYDFGKNRMGNQQNNSARTWRFRIFCPSIFDWRIVGCISGNSPAIVFDTVDSKDYS